MKYNLDVWTLGHASPLSLPDWTIQSEMINYMYLNIEAKVMFI